MKHFFILGTIIFSFLSYQPNRNNEVDYSYFDYYGDVNIIYLNENEYKLSQFKCKLIDSLARKLDVKFDEYITQPKFTIYQKKKDDKSINKKRVMEIVNYLKSKNRSSDIKYEIVWKTFEDIKYDENKYMFSGKILITIKFIIKT